MGHTQEFRLVMQHIDAGFDAQRKEFASMLEKQVNDACLHLREELEAKIGASHKDLEERITTSHQGLETRISALENKLWALAMLLITMFGTMVAMSGILVHLQSG